MSMLRGGSGASLLRRVSGEAWGGKRRLTGVAGRGIRDFGTAELHGFAMRFKVVAGTGGVSSARVRGETATYRLGGEPPAGAAAKGPTQ